MAHLSNATKSRFEKTPRQWLRVGSQINDLVNEWAERGDIVTFVGEGAGHGAPACFVPKIAEMEVDVKLAFGEHANPRFMGDLSNRKIQFDYPVAMGAVMHEAFHAKHSKFDLEAVSKIKDKFIGGLIMWFEETRIEARAVDALPKNKSFLRACALRLVIGDLKDDEDFSGRGIQAFSQLMLLTLARVDAGSLKGRDVTIVQDAAEKLFGKAVLKQLRSVWLRAQKHRDDSAYAPLEKLAEEWVEILKESGNDPQDGAGGEIPEWLKELLEAMIGEGDAKGDGEGEESDESGEGSGSGKGSPGEEGEGTGSGSGGLLEQMADDAEFEAEGESFKQSVKEVMEERAEKMAEAAAESKKHRETAAEVFGRGTGPGGTVTSSRLVEERAPSPQERSAAVALSKLLEKARYRDRVVTKHSSVVPPGRINARKALAGAEQRSRGAEVTAEPWARKARKHTEDPTLDVGVLVDISGSMSSAMEPMAATAWVLPEAVRRIQGRCAMVYYGDDVFPTLKPGQRMDKVKVYNAPDGTERFDKAFKALDGTLNLIGGTGARLLVIVSDLYYTGHEGKQTLYWMDRCRRAGVAVIVVPFRYEDHAAEVIKGVKAGGVELVPNRLTKDVVGAAKAIGTSAVRQLEKVSS